MTADVKLCTAVLDTGVHVNGEWPHCIDADRCTASAKCFWRGFHQLADDVYRKKHETAQKELFT